MIETYEPRILVLEGLWSDTSALLFECGAEADEVMPWDIETVEAALKYGNYDGLLLTGGADIDPRLYSEKPHKYTTGVDAKRDMGEMLALSMAERQGIPVLGICRGSQIMCAYKGGKLTQHIEGHRGGEHPVVAAPNAKTFTRAINSREMDVISLHHQCIAKPGKGMKVAAYANDGTPEAIESDDGKWLGVQFHPEINALNNGNSFAIFQWFVRACAKNRGKIAAVPNYRDVRKQVMRQAEMQKQERATKAAKDAAEGKGTTTIASKAVNKVAAKHRKAGTRSYSEGTEAWTKFDEDREGLFVCSQCAILFDDRADRDDHEAWLHGNALMSSRYPELLPPANSEAWEDDADDGYVNVELDPRYVNDEVH